MTPVFSFPLCHTARCLLGLPMMLVAAPAFAQSEPETPPPTLPQVEVQAQAEPIQAGATVTIEGKDLERAASMADVVRYQPLVSAPGTVAGTSRNRSEHERSGTSGYNIRGVENNRVGLDVDGVELPEALNRPQNSRAGIGTVGVGRDYIDPDLYIGADIQSGTTTAKRSAGGIGGAVSFRTKSALDYLRGDATAYIGAKAGHNTTDRSWHESLTAAGRQGQWDGLLAFSRRDGAQTRNNSAVKDYPDDWHSNALLLKNGLTLNASQRLQLSAELYRRTGRTQFDGWNSDGDTVTSVHRQKNTTARDAVQLQHLYSPSAGAIDRLDTRLTWQRTKTLDDTHSLTLATDDLRRIESGYETASLGVSTSGEKRLGLHHLSFGVNATYEDTERPWQLTDNNPPYSGTGVPPLMPSQPDTKVRRWGIFVEDDISWSISEGRRLALVPGLRVDRVHISPTNFERFASDLRSPEDMAQVYGGKHAHTLVSPSLSLLYDLKPRFAAYAQIKRTLWLLGLEWQSAGRRGQPAGKKRNQHRL